MERRAREIEVVVLDGDDAPEVARPPVRPRPWSVAVVALLATLAVLGLPVADPEVADPGPTTARTSIPDRTRTDGCPPPETRRLWCSFVADSSCCPGVAPGAGSPASGIRLASSSASRGWGTGGEVARDRADACGDPGSDPAAVTRAGVTRRA